MSGRGAAGGGRRPTSFFLGFGCPREFWSSERAGGCSRGISYHGREGVISTTTYPIKNKKRKKKKKRRKKEEKKKGIEEKKKK